MGVKKCSVDGHAKNIDGRRSFVAFTPGTEGQGLIAGTGGNELFTSCEGKGMGKHDSPISLFVQTTGNLWN